MRVPAEARQQEVEVDQARDVVLSQIITVERERGQGLGGRAHLQNKPVSGCYLVGKFDQESQQEVRGEVLERGKFFGGMKFNTTVILTLMNIVRFPTEFTGGNVSDSSKLF